MNAQFSPTGNSACVPLSSKRLERHKDVITLSQMEAIKRLESVSTLYCVNKKKIRYMLK